MELKKLVCPNCGANIDDLSDKILVCSYCGSSIYNPHYQEPEPEPAPSPVQSVATTAHYDGSADRYSAMPPRGRRPYGSPPHGRPVNNQPPHARGEHGRPINKTIALLLCLFLGFYGAHKFYEGKMKLGVLYMFTAGLFFIGWITDFLSIFFKPNPYYVHRR